MPQRQSLIEPLEPRRLLAAAGAGAVGPLGSIDIIRPTGTLTSAPPQTITGARYYQFTVTYTDNVALNVRSFDAWDTLVTDPLGVRRYAAVLRISNAANGTPRAVTYMTKAPGGRFDAADNGVYTISLRKQQVADTAGNKNAGRILGQFSVAITPIAASVPEQEHLSAAAAASRIIPATVRPHTAHRAGSTPWPYTARKEGDAPSNRSNPGGCSPPPSPPTSSSTPSRFSTAPAPTPPPRPRAWASP